MKIFRPQMEVYSSQPGTGDRMRICYLITHATTSRFLRGQLRQMRQWGLDVTVVASPGSELDQLRESEGVDIRCVLMQREIRPWHDLRSLLRLYLEIRALRPQIVNAGTPKAGFLGMLAAWAARVPVRIYTLHGLRLETTAGAKRALLTTIERLTCWFASRVICVSHSLRDSVLRRRLGPAEKLVVLGSGSCNGLNTSQFLTQEHPTAELRRAEVRQRLHIPAGAFVLGTVGRITRDKGVADLLAAFDRMRASCQVAHLLLIGDVEPGDPPPESCIRRIKTDPRIHWTGAVADATTYYPAMDVLVHASSREGFPYVPLEAAASGLPAVGYRVTGTVDAIADGETGRLVPQGDIASLSDAACRYWADPNLRRQHGRAGRLRVEREFAPREVWSRLHHEYLRLLHERTSPRPSSYRLAKRVLDCGIAALALVVLCPLLAVVALLVRWRLGKPVLFWQQRAGLLGRPFWMPKFRTMTDERDARGELLPDEQRLTPFGRFLRSTSLDELPELWNMLRGEMSLVGPRPLLVEYLDHYTPRQRRRHEVRPGLTGWAQVNGRNAIDWPTRLEMDVWYVDHMSLWLDVRILLKTVRCALQRRGIHADGHVTMPRFDASLSAGNLNDRAA